MAMNNNGMSAPASKVEGLEPWQLTRDEWNAERERLRPCVAQSNFTKGSASEAVARHQRLEWLLYNVRADASRRLKAAANGEIEIAPDEAAELLDQLETPVSYDDVIARAKALGVFGNASTVKEFLSVQDKEPRHV